MCCNKTSKPLPGSVPINLFAVLIQYDYVSSRSKLASLYCIVGEFRNFDLHLDEASLHCTSLLDVDIEYPCSLERTGVFFVASK